MLKQHKKVLLTERRQAVTYELPIIQQGEILLISALLLHQKLKVKTRFNDWFQRRIEKYGFEINIDFYSNLSKSKTKPITDYLLSVDMAKEIAMLEENEIGRQIRKYFIAKEKELRGISQLPKESQLFKGLKCTNTQRCWSVVATIGVITMQDVSNAIGCTLLWRVS
jgi:phage anti-repressor protein